MPLGTVKTMVVPLTTVKLVTMKLPMRMTVAPVKLVPVTVTTVPGPPVVGVKLMMVGAGGAVTAKVRLLEVPAALVTVTGKLPTVATAAAGMVTASEVAVTLVGVYVTPLKLTVEVAVKPEPAMVRGTAGPPTTWVLGESEVITGVTTSVKVPVLVALPPGVVTAMVPLVAPAGTVKMMVVALTTVKPVTATPLSVRAVAPVKFVPVTVTVVPTGPLAGVKLTMVGAGVVTVNVAAAEVPPPGAALVTVTL